MARTKHGARILYLDIETAPTKGWFWSLRQRYINPEHITDDGYTLCWAAMWEGEREVHFASYEGGEKSMLESMWELLDEADAVVHYNGTKFDMPTLNREFARFNMPPPSHYHQIDLLKTVRKQFRFTSNKLDYVCQRLGLGNKVKHKGMQLWEECMEGDKKAWRIMEKYNKRDVRLLKKLYKRLLPWIHNHPNLGMWVENPKKPVCPNCGSQNMHSKGAQYNTKTQSYQRYTCQSCHTPARARLSSKKTSSHILVRTP